MFPRREIADSDILRRSAGELRSTFGEVLGATFADPLLRPTQLLAENIRQQQLEGPIEDPFTLTGELIDEEDRPDPSTFISPETAMEEFGVDIDTDAPEDVVRLIAKRQRDEEIRRDVIARGPTGPGVTAAQLGVSLAGAAIDPINIASAFVPVVSQARYAGFVARSGLTAGRAAKGAIEGVVGAALVEPLTFSLADDVGLDYSMSDTLVNIGLGGLLGAGLHVVGGKTHDLLTGANPQQVEAALRASVAHLGEGKDVHAGDIFELTDEMRVADPGETFEGRALREKGEAEAIRAVDDFDADLARELGDVPKRPLPERLEGDEALARAEQQRAEGVEPVDPFEAEIQARLDEDIAEFRAEGIEPTSAQISSLRQSHEIALDAEALGPAIERAGSCLSGAG